MNRDELKRKTCIIIRKDNQYLVGTVLYSTDLRWSVYRSDAWMTRDEAAAKAVAEKVGGTPMLFNPVVNQMKVL